MAPELSHNVSKHVEVLRRRVGHDVAVLGPSHNTPRSQRQSTDDDKTQFRLNEATEKLIKERSTQWARRAASRNSNSLRASKIVSSRFTASGRCPSARSRNRRTRSPSGSLERRVDRSAIEPKHYRAFALKRGGASGMQDACQLRIWGTERAGKSSKSPWPLIRRLHEERFGPRPSEGLESSSGSNRLKRPGP